MASERRATASHHPQTARRSLGQTCVCASLSAADVTKITCSPLHRLSAMTVSSQTTWKTLSSSLHRGGPDRGRTTCSIFLSLHHIIYVLSLNDKVTLYPTTCRIVPLPLLPFSPVVVVWCSLASVHPPPCVDPVCLMSGLGTRRTLSHVRRARWAAWSL